MAIQVALSAMPGEGFRAAGLPLFVEGLVDGLEWTYELGFGARGIPPELEPVLGAFAAASALSFHGVSASPVGAAPESFGETCRDLDALARRHRPTHLSEHFGFASGTGFLRSAPMPVPFTRGSVERARERLRALGNIAGTRVGIENLAFAFSRRDVDAEPAFLDAIVRPLGGFLVLDLHNLLCRARNFGIDPSELLGRYPADLVECLHLSGGSESEVPSEFGEGTVRRDTHDGAVPEALFALLAEALDRCPSVRQVVLERIPEALTTEADRTLYQQEFRRIRGIVAGRESSRSFETSVRTESTTPLPRELDESIDLGWQDALLEALEIAAARGDVRGLLQRLRDDPRSRGFEDELDAMEPRMLDVAMRLHRRWSVRA